MRGSSTLQDGNAVRDQTNDRAAIQKLPVKRLPTMPLHHCDRPVGQSRRRATRVRSETLYRQPRPNGLGIRRVASRGAVLGRGRHSRQRLTPTRVGTTRPPASICRRRACAGLTPDHSCRGTRCTLDPICPHRRPPTGRRSPCGLVAIATATPAEVRRVSSPSPGHT